MYLLQAVIKSNRETPSKNIVNGCVYLTGLPRKTTEFCYNWRFFIEQICYASKHLPV